MSSNLTVSSAENGAAAIKPRSRAMARSAVPPMARKRDIFVRVEVVSLEVNSDGEIGKSARAGNADDLPAQLFDGFGFLAAEQRVIRVVGLGGDDMDVQPFGSATNWRLSAADAGEVDIAGD